MCLYKKNDLYEALGAIFSISNAITTFPIHSVLNNHYNVFMSLVELFL